eukprot:s7017_g5.t1
MIGGSEPVNRVRASPAAAGCAPRMSCDAEAAVRFARDRKIATRALQACNANSSHRLLRNLLFWPVEAQRTVPATSAKAYEMFVEPQSRQAEYRSSLQTSHRCIGQGFRELVRTAMKARIANIAEPGVTTGGSADATGGFRELVRTAMKARIANIAEPGVTTGGSADATGLFN